MCLPRGAHDSRSGTHSLSPVSVAFETGQRSLERGQRTLNSCICNTKPSLPGLGLCLAYLFIASKIVLISRYLTGIMMTTQTTFPLDVVQNDLQAIVAALNQGAITSVGLVQEYIRKSDSCRSGSFC